MSEIDTKGYVYVMISTLNQMVNYIPLKHFEFDDIYNLTIKESDYVDNSKWDEQLSKVLKRDDIEFDYKTEDKNLSFQQDDINDISNIIDVLEANFSDEDKVFWNITGGQRPFILAISKFIRDNNRTEDYICYLEGNKSKMVIFQDNELVDNDFYNLEDLKISTALELMGFKVNKEMGKNYSEELKIQEFYSEFLKQYEGNKELREKLISLNKKDTDKDKTISEIRKLVKNLDTTLLNEIFTYSEKDENKQKKLFGYILESLAGYKILEIAKDKIADINFSEKINHLRKEDRTREQEIDEFDIALLTKNGKFMIFECKSGGMEGDVAKSTKYSTYAVSGVYGKPILITPLLKKEIKAIRDKSTLSEDYSDDYKYLNDALYKTIRQAINSAIRSGLEVWGLDEIEDRLKKYIAN